MRVFCDVVFAWILGGFWDGFGRPKSLIFVIFETFFQKKIDLKLKLKKSLKIAPLAGGKPLPRGLTPYGGTRWGQGFGGILLKNKHPV